MKGKKSLNITMCLKLKEKITIPLAQKKLINDDYEVIFELVLLVSNIEKGSL
jgi:hypothetical protein